MTPFANHSTCYLLDVKYSKAYNAQILYVYQVGDTVLDSIYIKNCRTLFMYNVSRYCPARWIWLKLGPLERHLLKRGTEVLRKIRPSPGDSRLKLQCHLIHVLAIWKQIVNVAHSSVSGLLFTTDRCWQRHYEQILNLLPMAQGTF